MLRRWIGAVAVLFLVAGAVTAAETKGKFVKFDAAGKVLTVDVSGKETNFNLTDDVKVTTVKGEPTKKGIQSFANPKVSKAGARLTIVTEKKGDKEVVTEIKLGGRDKK